MLRSEHLRYRLRWKIKTKPSIDAQPTATNQRIAFAGMVLSRKRTKTITFAGGRRLSKTHYRKDATMSLDPFTAGEVTAAICQYIANDRKKV